MKHAPVQTRPMRPMHPTWAVARHAVTSAATWAVAGLVLTAVFTAYLDPDLAFALATRAWACF